MFSSIVPPLSPPGLSRKSGFFAPDLWLTYIPDSTDAGTYALNIVSTTPATLSSASLTHGQAYHKKSIEQG